MLLHFKPRSQSVRARWLLEELSVPYELVRLTAEGPLALVDDDLTFPLSEASAVCLIHLADRFPEKQLAPPIGSHLRGRYYH